MRPLPGRIVLASSNVGKLRELARLLEHLPVTLLPQSEFAVTDADETGTTFTENSLIKARHAALATGLPAIADDSGLAVDALAGRPGVYSARYAGPGATDELNIDKLLAELDDVDEPQRTAAFHCVACLVLPDDSPPLVASGVWHGSILRARRGDGGFGYDPVFLDSESGRSSAELTGDEKSARSHRGNALRALVAQIAAHFVTESRASE